MQKGANLVSQTPQEVSVIILNNAAEKTLIFWLGVGRTEQFESAGEERKVEDTVKARFSYNLERSFFMLYDIGLFSFCQ
ncbi:MAG: hypothetical protein WCH34_16500 [Bacteroidota bacterium]